MLIYITNIILSYFYTNKAKYGIIRFKCTMKVFHYNKINSISFRCEVKINYQTSLLYLILGLVS